MSLQLMQIGEVADRVGLSLRTIRYYEEVGLVRPADRTSGGFRLYGESDVARLDLVKRMKTLEFSLDEMRDLLKILDELDAAHSREVDHDKLVDRLVMYRIAADQRCGALRAQLDTAESFAADLRTEISRKRRTRRQA